MSIQLTAQQQQAIDERGEAWPRFVDPRTNAAYILVPEAEYEDVRELLDEERQRRAFSEVAVRNAVGRMEETP